jgi:hypothetical protein
MRRDCADRLRAVLRTTARFPEVGVGKGHYESFYLKACHPSEPLGVWIRYTVHKHSGEEPQGSLWFTLFDASAEGPQASKLTTADVSAPDGEYIRIGDSAFGDGRVAGAAPTDQLDASWELSFGSEQDALFHLPRDWMYRAPVPKTKLLTPYPDARFDGVVRAGGHEVAVEGWRGMIGHNWGTQHAERWIWLHGAGFDGADDVWLDAAIGRIKLGPWTTPWIGNGALGLGGKRYRLGGLERTRSTRIDESPNRCRFILPGDGVRVSGEVGADRADFVAWIYSDPDGGRHDTVNCSAAAMTLKVERDGEAPVSLTTDGGATYELGMREQDHGIALQPFPDP